MSSFQPPLYISDVFNSSLYDFDKDNTLTIFDADRRYLKLSGGTIFGYSTFNNGLAINNGLTIDGSIIDLSIITGITNGTALANKALVLDSNKDITGLRNLSATNTISSASLSLTGSNPSINLASSGNINNSFVITNTSTPTYTVGLGLGYSGMAGEGRIIAYNWITNTKLNLNFNYGQMFLQGSTGYFGINTVSPYYSLHVNGVAKATNILVGTSTDTTRMISCLDSSMVNTNSRYITVGYDNSDSNQLELGFKRDTTNSWSVGFHTHQMIYGVSGTYYVGINRSSPSYQLDCNGVINGSSYRVGGSEVINSSKTFVGSGGIDVSNRIYMRVNGYGLSIRGDSSYNDFELVTLVDGGGCHIGSYTNHAFSLMTNNVDRMRIFNTGTISIGTNSSSNARLYLTSGIGNSTIIGSDIIQKIERSGFSQPLEPIIVSNPSLIALDNIITYGAIFVASDRRLKKDIQSFDEDEALRFVQNIEPIRYRKKEDNNNRFYYGYIAQELLKHRFGQLIDIQEDQNMMDEGDEYDLKGYRLSVDYNRVCVLLHKSIQYIFKELDDIRHLLDKSKKLTNIKNM